MRVFIYIAFICFMPPLFLEGGSYLISLGVNKAVVFSLAMLIAVSFSWHVGRLVATGRNW